MAKSTVDRLHRGHEQPEKLSPASGQKAKSLGNLKAENQRLRDLVISLSAALVRHLGDGNERRAVVTADAAQSDTGLLSKPFPGRDSLTSRERAVLAEILKGASNKEAALALSISARTVEFHRANILLKLSAKNTADLVRIVLGE
jgi:DNA-binding NarL/FixJ family response regulator